MKSGAAAVATTTMTGSAEPQVRRKRQATALPPESAKCNDTQYPYNDGSPKAESYNVWECADGTAFMVFQGEFCVAVNISRTLRESVQDSPFLLLRFVTGKRFVHAYAIDTRNRLNHYNPRRLSTQN